jgi:hypothetical protein
MHFGAIDPALMASGHFLADLTSFWVGLFEIASRATLSQNAVLLGPAF